MEETETLITEHHMAMGHANTCHKKKNQADPSDFPL